MQAPNRVVTVPVLMLFCLFCISTLLGSILITIFDAPDEMYHFQRIYDESISKKELYIPENTINLGIGFSDHRLANDCIAKPISPVVIPGFTISIPLIIAS